MSTIQRVAQIFGWVFVVLAVWGFFVSGGSMVADPATAPKVMGLFPVNLLHNLIHLAFGVWGIMAARSIAGAKSYALVAGAIYLVLTILGFITPTTFGLVPIGGSDIWLHALIAIVLLGAWASARSATATPAEPITATEPRPAVPGDAAARGIGTSPAAPPASSGRPATGGPTAPPTGGGTKEPGERGGTGGSGGPGTRPPSGPGGPGTPPPSGPGGPGTPPPSGPGTPPPGGGSTPRPGPERPGEGDRRP